MNELITELIASLSLSDEELVLLGGVLFFFLINMCYWLAVPARVATCRLPAKPAEVKQQPVSIILSARNEYQMLQKNLPAILEQDYPEFEVIVVNDCSEDDSETLLASMQKNHPNLVFRSIVKDEIFRHGKKMPLGVGIKAAKYDLFLFIDADCKPASKQWLQNMQRCFTAKKDIVIGYTRLGNAPKWIRADRFMQSLNFLGKALIGRANMASNSNLAYRKRLFFDNKGFDMRVTGHLREDIVFVNKTATKTNTAVALWPDAGTISSLRYTSREWRRYRVYELDSLTMAGRGVPGQGEVIFRSFFFAAVAIVAAMCSTNYVVLAALGFLLLLRFIMITFVFRRSQKRLGERGLLFTLWLWDLFSPFYHFQLFLLTHFKRKKSWR